MKFSRSYVAALLIAIMMILPWCCTSSENDIRIQYSVSEELLHSHDSDITYRGLSSGILRYNLLDRNTHSHTYELTPEEFSWLEMGLPVVIRSTENQHHSHTVTLQKQEF